MRVAFAVRLLTVAVGTMLTGLVAAPAIAQQSSDQIVVGERWGAGYFVEFRSRPSSYIGHTYIVYGQVGADGRVVEANYAGLIPELDGWKGLIVPIPANVRQYKDDTRLKPTAVYHRTLTATEYRRLVRTVNYLQSIEHKWHGIFQNCNDFGIQIADALGMARPPSLMPPAVWVGTLRLLNQH